MSNNSESSIFVPDPNWWDKAACLGSGPDLFFPHDDQKITEEGIEQAKRICANCIVKLDCLNYAFSKPEKYGIWGGMTEQERAIVSRSCKK